MGQGLNSSDGKDSLTKEFLCIGYECWEEPERRHFRQMYFVTSRFVISITLPRLTLLRIDWIKQQPERNELPGRKMLRTFITFLLGDTAKFVFKRQICHSGSLYHSKQAIRAQRY